MALIILGTWVVFDVKLNGLSTNQDPRPIVLENPKIKEFNQGLEVRRDTWKIIFMVYGSTKPT